MSADANPEFDADVERGMRTPPMLPMPEFKPLVGVEEVEALAGLSKEYRTIMLPVMRALSIQNQRTMHLFHEAIVTRGGLREVERKALDWRTSTLKVILWILTTLLGSWIGAAALAHYHQV